MEQVGTNAGRTREVLTATNTELAQTRQQLAGTAAELQEVKKTSQEKIAHLARDLVSVGVFAICVGQASLLSVLLFAAHQNETIQDLGATKHRLAVTSTELNQAREELASTKAILREVTETTGQSVAVLTAELVRARVGRDGEHVYMSKIDMPVVSLNYHGATCRACLSASRLDRYEGSSCGDQARPRDDKHGAGANARRPCKYLFRSDSGDVNYSTKCNGIDSRFGWCEQALLLGGANTFEKLRKQPCDRFPIDDACPPHPPPKCTAPALMCMHALHATD